MWLCAVLSLPAPKLLGLAARAESDGADVAVVGRSRWDAPALASVEEASDSGGLLAVGSAYVWSDGGRNTPTDVALP